MKVAFLIILFFGSLISFSQISEKSVQYLIDPNVKMSIEEIQRSFTKSYEEFYEYSPFYSAIKMDVFNYFSLNENYDSELKKSMFEKTQEYKILLDSISKVKNTFLKNTYYQVSLNQVYEFSIEYDMLKKGFIVAIGEVLPYHCTPAFLPKVLGGIEFKQLNIIKKYNLYQSKNSYTQYLFFPMAEKDAIELENNKESIEYLLIFNIQGIKASSFIDQDFIKDNQKNCKIQLVKGGDLRFIIYNKKSNQIYLDKLYKKDITK